ncbi:aspartate aminotransferase family protein [bacterium]|nr:aspartate aminotransferase family protein [bacterium]
MNLLERKRRVLMPCLYHFFGDDPLHLVDGKGTVVRDDRGREYLDFYSGVAVNGLGHCHPEVVEAAAQQMRKLQHTTTIFLTEPMIELAEKLVDVAPRGLSRVFFCADGSGANEGALIAARIATGRPAFLAFRGGLHGRTSLTMATTGLPMWQADPFRPEVVIHVDHPMNVGMDVHFSQLQQAIASKGADYFAAFIAEPICGNGGILVPPDGYFQKLRAFLQEHGILLIADEVQTGFCRTGEWFGLQNWETSPDLMSVAKALGNGLPIAAWMATEEVAARLTSPQASTFGGNLVPVAAALKVLEIMQRENLATESRRKGERFKEMLRAIDDDGIVDVRGKGLMIGVELSHEGQPATDRCDAVLRSLRDNGILAGKTGPGRNVLTFEPPLIVSDDELERVATATADAMAATREVLA